MNGESKESPEVLSEPDPRALTPRQTAIVEFIDAYAELHGCPPSVREIGEHVGLRSTSSVHRQLCELERLGALRRLVREGRERAAAFVSVGGEVAA